MMDGRRSMKKRVRIDRRDEKKSGGSGVGPFSITLLYDRILMRYDNIHRNETSYLELLFYYYYILLFRDYYKIPNDALFHDFIMFVVLL
jgi:hypothetical protein